MTDNGQNKNRRNKIMIQLVYNWFKRSILDPVYKSITISRQMKENEYLAKCMIHEYPEHTVQSLLHELNRKSIEGYT